VKQTQYEAILAYLKRRGSATIGDLNATAGTNWAHKRIAEMTDRDGWVVLWDGSTWGHRAYRILRFTVKSAEGRNMRLYRLVRG
jgi:hypothetical protein